MIEINLQKLERGTKTEWITVKRGGKTFKQRFKTGKKETVEPKKLSKMKDMNITERMERKFGSNVVSNYNDKISKLTSEELHAEFKGVIENKHFRKRSFGEWVRRMDENDANATEILGLDKINSKWDWDFEGDPDSLSDEYEDAWMKSVLLNQEELKRRNPDGYIHLYRGMGGNSYDEAISNGLNPGDEFKMRTYNLSSWSEYSEAADSYASLGGKGIVAEMNVPIGNIIWSTRMVGEILQEDVITTKRINDGIEHCIVGGGYIPISISSLKQYPKKITEEEFKVIKKGIHEREGL